MYLDRDGVRAGDNRAALSTIAIRRDGERADGVDISCACPVCGSNETAREDPGTTADEGVRSIAPGGTLTGVVNSSGDIDYFNFNVVAGRTYTVVLTGSGGGSALLDSVLTVTRSGTVVVSDDDGGLGANSLVTFTATATGTYQIRAQAAPDTGETGQYTIDLRQMGTDSSTPSNPTPIAAGSTAIGFLETGGDVDTYAVYLEAGHYYTFEAAGGVDHNSGYFPYPPGELFTDLTLLDPNRDELPNGPGFLEGYPGGISFTPTESGTYYIRVAADGTNTGGFALRVQDLTAGDPLDSIDWGTEVPTNNITVYFAPKGESYDGVTSNGWSDYEIAQAMEALDTYADVANLNFSITTNQSTATFTLVTTTSNEFLGYFYPPGTLNAGMGVFATNGTGWNDTGGLEPGGYGFVTLVHEFGHALGLAHPHDTGGNSTVMPLVESDYDYGLNDLNQGVYTTMSYNDGWPLHPGSHNSRNYGYQSGPGALDIALLQEKYGARSHNTGNNVYVLPTANAKGTFYDVIWDTRGTDTIRHDGTVAAIIDLTAATIDYSPTGGGVISFVSGIHGGFTIAAGVVIENATGGSGNDTLVGNAAYNVLNGRGGADAMEGRAGNDQYLVDDSADTVVEATRAGTDLVKASVSYTLTANVENLTLTGTAGISGTGNELNNVITGNRGRNTLTGGAGRDTLNGGLGGDSLLGGTGNDTYVVDNAADVVTELGGQGSDLVQSSMGFTLGDNVEKLTLTGTAGISGTGNGVANVITGNGAANELFGLNGSDTINGGGGADDLYGGVGKDRLTGGEGSDDFYFDTALTNSNIDAILDFVRADDSIYLDLSVFSGIAAAGALAAGAFRLGTAAQDASDRIIYDKTTGNIYYDADGSGSGTAVLFAQVTAGTTLSSSDFFAY